MKHSSLIVFEQIRVVNVFQEQAAGHVPRQSISSITTPTSSSDVSPFRRLDSQQSAIV